ncbi:hypothetical protein APE_1956 [Aeropyrum pernix K1]|uniref:Uncharacterized protein n=2 Tax=Aeropyrum pernix TaxID=56636 RepID=Q9YAI4_AERPE|nr:hypothetical protein APE_1956 [Aeropyrum pernix K1]
MYRQAMVMSGGPLDRHLTSHVASVIKEFYSREGFTVRENEHAVDIIVEANIGVTRIRIGFLVDCNGDFYSCIGRAYAAWKDGVIDKAVIIVSDQSVPASIAGKFGFIDFVFRDEIEAMVSARAVEGETVETFHYKPNVSVEDVLKLAEKHRGRFIKKGEFVGASTAFIPLYCFDVDFHTVDFVEDVLEHATAVLCFDGITGSTAHYDEGLRILGEWRGLGLLSNEAVAVLKRIAELGEASIAELKEEFGGSVDVESIIEVLVEKRLVEPIGMDIFALAEPPLEAAQLERILESKFAEFKTPGSPSCGFTMKPRVSVHNIVKILSAFGAVKGHRIVYYPLVLLVYRREVKGRTIEITILVDGLVKKRLAEVEELLGESPAVSDIDKIIEHILKKRDIEVCR